MLWTVAGACGVEERLTGLRASAAGAGVRSAAALERGDVSVVFVQAVVVVWYR